MVATDASAYFDPNLIDTSRTVASQTGWFLAPLIGTIIVAARFLLKAVRFWWSKLKNKVAKKNGDA